ncbi:MAG: hypothetical protein ACK5UQ_16130, partial [Planctomycetota bacterium]
MSRTTATFLLFVGMLAAYHALVGRRHLAEIAAANAELAAAYARYDAAEGEAATELLLQADADRLHELHAQLLPPLAGDASGGAPLLLASDALARDGLRVDRTEAMAPDPTLKRPNARIKVTIAGPFARLFAALQNLENSLPPTRVTELTLVASSAAGEVRGEMVV